MQQDFLAPNEIHQLVGKKVKSIANLDLYMHHAEIFSSL